MVARDKQLRFFGRSGFPGQFGAFFATLLGVGSVFADQTDDTRSQAEILFNEGRAAVAASDYATACPKFEQSLKLARRAGTLFNLAQCEEHEKRLVSAVQYYKEGIVVLEPGDPRLGPSKKQLANVEPRLPYLTINLAGNLPPGGRVTLDGREIEALDKEFAINPGKHEIKVLAPHYADESMTFDIAEAARETKTVQAGARLPDPPPPPNPLNPRRIGAIVAYGVGGLGFIGAVVTGGWLVSVNNRVQEECKPTVCKTAAAFEVSKQGKPLLIANTVAWGLGLSGAGVGTFLLLYKRKQEKPKTQPTQSLVVGPGFVGLEGSF
jgi:hypothetical protein